MARGKTLIDILTSYRTEARLSLNPAHNVGIRNSQVAVIQPLIGGTITFWSHQAGAKVVEEMRSAEGVANIR